jgi:hypothetical protein
MAKLSDVETNIRVELRSRDGRIITYTADRLLLIPEGMPDITAIQLIENAVPAFLRQIWDNMRASEHGNGMQPYDSDGRLSELSAGGPGPVAMPDKQLPK